MVNIKSGVGLGGGNKFRMAGEKKIALGGDNLGGYGALGIAGSVFGLGIKGIQSAVEGGKRLRENIEKRVNPDRETSFFSPSGNEVAQLASADLSGLQVRSKDVQVANLNDYTKGTYTPTYPGDDYKDVKPKRTLSDVFDDPANRQAIEQGRFGSEELKDRFRLKDARRLGGEYTGLSDEAAIDLYKRRHINYETGEDSFRDKLQYDTKTLKRYMAADAKENYEKKEKAAKEASEAKIARVADEAAYRAAHERFDKPSLTDRVSNFVFGTDKKGEPDPMNKYIVSQPERLKRLREADKAYGVPGISVDQYGFVDVPQSKLLTKSGQFGAEEAEKKEKNTVSNDISAEEFNKNYIEAMTKFRRVAEGKTPNPNLMERTQNFLGSVAGTVSDTVGNVVDNVSKVFTPKVEAGTLEGKPTRFTMGEANEASMSTPSVGDMGGSGSSAQSSRVRTLGRPQPRVQSPMEAGMGPGAAKARAMAKARNKAKQSGTAAPSMSGADRAKSLAKARIAKKKKSKSSGGGFGGSTSSSSTRSGINRSQSRRRSSGGSRSRGSTGSSSSKSSSSSRSRSNNTSRSRRGGTSSSRSRGGVSRGSRRRGGRRGRRGGRRCDLRCKINIMPLTNMHLQRDELAQVAYFVTEIKSK